MAIEKTLTSGILAATWLGVLAVPGAGDAAVTDSATLTNGNFQLRVVMNAGAIKASVTDLKQNVVWADGVYQYQLGEEVSGKLTAYSGLTSPRIGATSGRIRIHGQIRGFEIEHDLLLAPGSLYLGEEMRIVNMQGVRRTVKTFHTAFSKRIASTTGTVLTEFAGDHFQAVPFLRRSDRADTLDFTMAQIVAGNGFAFSVDNIKYRMTRTASPYFISEGFGWRHGTSILGIFSFNQDNMIFSSLGYDNKGNLQFGGFTKEGLNLSALERFEPAETIYLGLNRLYPLSGDYNQISHAYRNMLDELGCRFPKDFNPPVHWEQLYGMKGAWNHRQTEFTRDILLSREVPKAIAYSCQALYLDPGWDTEFGTFLWGTAWLGDCKSFIAAVESSGLKTSLHTPLSPWASNQRYKMGPFGVDEWPAASRRKIVVNGNAVLAGSGQGPQICLASKQYLDTAEKRLLQLCEAGVAFLMFDGTWWNGPCADPAHGHPMPLVYEDNFDYCVELAQRVHAKYPNVLIEMHDMLTGGSKVRATPVYYKYGLPGSFDENWGFELMWKPFTALTNGTGLALYYYDLGCNIPLYLHVDLGQDNANSLILWWYASTCRHLGIGTSDTIDKTQMARHQAGMKRYMQLQDFFKHGDFYGINPEIHFHTLPDKQQSVVNIFKLSSAAGITRGSISLDDIGLDSRKAYSVDKDWITLSNGKITITKPMKAWDTDLAVITPLFSK